MSTKPPSKSLQQTGISEGDIHGKRRFNKALRQTRRFSGLSTRGSPEPPPAHSLVASNTHGATIEPTPDSTHQQNSNMPGPASNASSLVPQKDPIERAKRSLSPPGRLQYGRSDSIRDKISLVANDTFSGASERRRHITKSRPTIDRRGQLSDHSSSATATDTTASEGAKIGEDPLDDLTKALEDSSEAHSIRERAGPQMHSAMEPPSATGPGEPSDVAINRPTMTQHRRSQGTKSSFGGIAGYELSDATLRTRPIFQNISAAFSAAGHYTISQDHTDSEDARKLILLASFGKKCGLHDHGDRKEAAGEHGSHETMQSTQTRDAMNRAATQAVQNGIDMLRTNEPGAALPKDMRKLPERDKQRVKDMAKKMFDNASEQQKVRLRLFLKRKMNSSELALITTLGKDPLLCFYENQAIRILEENAAQKATAEAGEDAGDLAGSYEV